MLKDAAPSVTVGARCYIPDDDAAWLPVYVEEVNEAKGLVTVRIQRPRKDRQNEDAADHDDADRTGDSRVVAMDLLHGTTDEERDALGLGDEAPRFAYLEEKEPQQENRPGRKPKLSQPPPPKPAAVIEAENAKDRALFAKTRQALSLLGLGSEQQNALFQVLSGILHLGEAQFVAKPDNDEACDLENDSV
ncbi:hypothetical protein PC112_g24089, partial [Phytophthora cactorum]